MVQKLRLRKWSATLSLVLLASSATALAELASPIAAIEASHAAVIQAEAQAAAQIAQARAQERVAIENARLHAIQQAIANGVPVPFLFQPHRGWQRRFMRFELFRPVGFGVPFGFGFRGRF